MRFRANKVGGYRNYSMSSEFDANIGPAAIWIAMMKTQPPFSIARSMPDVRLRGKPSPVSSTGRRAG